MHTQWVTNLMNDSVTRKIGVDMLTIYILCEEVDIIGVYKTRQEALNDALRYELHNWFIDEKDLKL